jgi:hypothetical protein
VQPGGSRTLSADVRTPARHLGFGFGVRSCAGQARGRSRLAVPPPRGSAPHRGIRRHARERARRRPCACRPRGLGLPGARCGRPPGARDRGLHRSVYGFAARARPAARCGRLGDEAMPSGGGPRARGSCGASPQASLRTGGLRAARRRRARDPGRPVPGLRPLEERGPHSPRVRGAPAARPGQGQGAPAKLEKASPDWSYIHTHFGVGYRFDPESRKGPAGEAPVEAVPTEAAAERIDVPGSGSSGLPAPDAMGDGTDATLLTG